jgi:hypothetical protein
VSAILVSLIADIITHRRIKSEDGLRGSKLVNENEKQRHRGRSVRVQCSVYPRFEGRRAEQLSAQW